MRSTVCNVHRVCFTENHFSARHRQTTSKSKKRETDQRPLNTKRAPSTRCTAHIRCTHTTHTHTHTHRTTVHIQTIAKRKLAAKGAHHKQAHRGMDTFGGRRGDTGSGRERILDTESEQGRQNLEASRAPASWRRRAPSSRSHRGSPRKRRRPTSRSAPSEATRWSGSPRSRVGPAPKARRRTPTTNALALAMTR